MYPNKEDFISPINGFIEKINCYEDLKITTFPTSTVVQGEYNHAMKAVQETIAQCYKEFNMAVYVAKIIPGYEAL
jgi:uncharacterized protein YqgV (UPF0045/DUF77 family)